MKKIFIGTIFLFLANVAFTQAPPRLNMFEFTTSCGRTMNIYYVLHGNQINDEMRPLIALHGMGRNARGMANDFRMAVARTENVAVIVPHFSQANFTGAQYNQLNIHNGTVIRPFAEWTFHIVDEIFLYFRERTGLRAERYILYGHSAGGQFVSRTFQLSQSPFLDFGLAANSGNFTFIDETRYYPNGIRNLMDRREDMVNSIQNRRLYIMIGTLDNDPDAHDLSRAFMEQGIHRYERNHNFYQHSRNIAQQNNISFNWELVVMEGVSHNAAQTLPFVVEVLRRTR